MLIMYSLHSTVSLKSSNVAKNGKLVGPKKDRLSTTQILAKNFESIYQIDLAKFQINNQKGNPVQTTNGINNAIQYAKSNGYTGALLPAGNYLIEANNSVNLVGDFTFYMTDATVLYKETNGNEYYDIIYVEYPNNNVSIIGGKLVGDKNTHQYNGEGTHEWGFGIQIRGSKNVTIKNVELSNFTGDGIILTGQNITSYIGESSAFRFGDINSSGEIIPSTSKILLSNSDMNLSSVHFQRTKELLVYPSSIDSLTNQSYAVYFYDQDNRFISSQKNVQFLQDSPKIPTGAYYYKLVFDAKKISPDLRVDVWAFYFAENVLVDNCNVHDNRRQGISVVGARNVTISNCILHDIKGTAPESGIDVEGGDYPNDTITIENNQFYNNESFDLIFYDGENLKASNNIFGSKGKVGLSTSNVSKNKTITNNVFNRTSAYVYGAAFFGNTTYSSKIFGYKSSTFENNTFENARLELYDANILVKGCTFINTDQSAGWNIYTPGLDFTISNSKFTGDPGASIAGGNAKNITYINSQFKDIGRTIYASKITNSTFTSTSPQSYMEVTLKENSIISGSTFNNVRVYIENSATSSATQKTIESSTFTFTENPLYSEPIVSVLSASNFVFKSNKINLNYSPAKDYRMVRFFKLSNAYSVKAATFSNNTFASKSASIAVDTTAYSGYNKPFYFQNNILSNATFKVRSIDKVSSTVVQSSKK